MEGLSDIDLEILEEALERWNKKLPFETALGKAVRRRDLPFQRYQALVEGLREIARKRKVDLSQAARMAVSQEE
ncbi:MAG: hypothetical protein ACLFUV_00690 [Methanomassiliicoccales archaeon]